MSDSKNVTPKQLAKKIEKAREDLAEIRADVAPDGPIPHESLHAIVKNADSVFATEDVAKYVADLKDD